MSFTLHPRLASGAHVTDLPLCRVMLKDDARWPWLILVPRRADLSELHQLSDADAQLLMAEIRAASAAVAALEGVTKINVGALGNEVPQLHIHVIGRNASDAAWPGPVWGVSGKVAYEPNALEALAATVRARLGRTQYT